MKIALYMEEGVEQVVLTPESEFETNLLGKLHDSGRELSIKKGSFYQCQGGWVRQSQNDTSTMLVLTPKSVNPPVPDLEPALKFCYALLAPGQDANEMIKQNPDTAKDAHRAIYERKPQLMPYDDMMASIPH